MTQPLSAEEREELELLLPWYVNGTLTAEDRARMDSALEADEGLRQVLDLTREEAGAIEEMLAALGTPDARVLDQVQRAAARRPALRSASWWQRLAAGVVALVPDLPRPALAAAGVAAFLLVAAQAGAIGWLLWKATPPSGIELAEGGGGTETSFRLIVRFSEEARVAEVTSLLEELALVVVDGPKADGLYVVGRLTDADGLPEAVTLSTLTARTGIVSYAASNRGED